MQSEFAAYFAGEWAFARGLTRDLLASLGDADLLVVPTRGMGPLWKQFRHLGRVQENYLRGLESGRVVFSPLDLPDDRIYAGGANRDALVAYLSLLDGNMSATIKALDWNKTIVWPDGEEVAAAPHLLRLVSHETLHHGIWLASFRSLGRPLPPSWAAWDPDAVTSV